MKKVLFIISKMDVGGAEKMLHDLALGLNKEEGLFKITVVCLYEKGKLGNSLSQRGVRVYDSFLRNKFDFAGIVNFIILLKRERPDILYITGQTLSQAVAFIGAMFVKKAVKIIGVHSHDLKKRRLYKLLIDRISFNSATKVVCVSRSQRDLIADKGVPLEKIEVIYNGVDVNRFKDIKDMKEKKLLKANGSVVIGTLASLREEKALDILLKAASEVLRRHPGTFFVIVGEGKERMCLEHLAKELRIDPSVRFLGEKDNVSEIIPSFDIACLSSRTENFPLALLECMACGKPVVATRIGGIPEMIEDGSSGILVRSESSNDLAKALMRLIEDRELCKVIGEKGRERVKELFTLEEMIGGYKKFLQKV